MKKRFLQRKNTRMYHVWLRSFMVCLCLALAGVSAWGQDKNYTFSGGRGTEDNPYLISSVEDLKEMAEAVNQGTASSTYNEKHYKLTADLTLSPGDVASWEPIGSKHFIFSGNFDGGRHIIDGFNVEYEITDENSFFGFFGKTTSQGNTSGEPVIKDLTIKGNLTINCSETISNTTNVNIGGICASLEGNGIIENCNYDGTITINFTGTFPYSIGGICGYVDQKCAIYNSSNKANLEITLQDIVSYVKGIHVGGIAGFCRSQVRIEESFNTGDIKIDTKNITSPIIGIGGISGYSDNESEYSKCFNSGNISLERSGLQAISCLGGISGISLGLLENAYNTGNIKVVGVTENYTYVAGLVGQVAQSPSTLTSTLNNCYNLGKVTISDGVKAGNVYSSRGEPALETSNCYYSESNLTNAIDKDNTAVKLMLENQFITGEVAWLLRQLNEEDRSYVFGQNLNGNSSDGYPKLQCFDSKLLAVYQLTLHKDAATTEIVYRNSANLNLPDVGDNFGWFDSAGKEYFNDSEITEDLELTAFDKSKLFTIKTDVQNGTILITPSQEKYPENAKIEFTLQENDGFQYEEGYLKCIKDEDNTEIKITNNNGTYSFTMPAADVTISAMFAPIPPTEYSISIDPNIQNGTVTSDNAKAVAGKTITLTVIPADGYELSELYYMVGTEKNPITGTTFTMPAANVTVYATFTEKEDPTDPEELVDPPVVDPTNYYNIYNETTYDFIDVSFSRNVVREGGSVNVYLGIPEGLDPAAVTLMFKRSLYGGWENLNTDDDGNYLINNIWTDIYVKAVVDESYIDPNPDENHIYIDLSETNDSIWLYTDHKLVEEGKTAVIQAEVAKSCQNKEIRYMYKRTVLGEWKEMPKDYSINQYVVRDITTDIYVKAYFVFDKQDPTTAKNPHHVYADITATCEGLYLDATRHKVADEGDTKVFLYVKKGFETKDARYLFKRGLKGEWEDLVPGIEQNTFQVTDIEGDIYLKGIDAIYTGTEDIDGMVQVYTKDGSLFVYTAQPEEISVVSMTGVTVKRTRQTGLQSYPLNQGIYVICVGEQVFKVRVK